MLSRVADSIYWMTRYIERAENIARTLEVIQHMSLDTSFPGGEQWKPLVETSGDEEEFAERYGEATAENVKRFLISDRDYANSIISCLALARENARTVRETISQPMWEEINKFYLFARDQACGEGLTEHTLETPAEFLKAVRLRSHMLHGLTNATMTHDDAFHVARLGRLIERADKTTRILDVKYFVLLPGGAEDVGTSLDVIQWRALLRSASALQMYRRRYGRIRRNLVAEFLLLDNQFPRSVRSCLIEAEDSLHKVTGTPIGSYGNRSEQLLGQLRSELDFTDIETVNDRGLHQYIDSIQERIYRLGEALYDDFFALRADRGRRVGEMTQSAGSGRMSQTMGGMSQTMG